MKKSSFLVLFIFFLLVSCTPVREKVTLALLGDLMLGRRVNPTPASLSYLAPQLQAADLALANLESPLVDLPPASGNLYDLCAPADRAGLLRGWGLDLLSLANNHRFDCNPNGPEETGRILTAAGLSPVGPGLQPVYRQIHGLKLAFFAFDDVSSPLDVAVAEETIQSARAQGRLVVVLVHWGLEYQAGSSDRQKDLAQRFASAGAALIVGSHPHVLQPAAWISTPRGKTLLLYSLGNVLFDQPGLPDTRQSALLLVGLDAHGVQSVRLVPFEIDVVHSLIIQPAADTAQKIHERLHLP